MRRFLFALRAVHVRPSLRPRPCARAGRAALAAAALALAPGHARAQDLQFRHLGVDDGLPSSWVTSIIRDRRGFMWFGSTHGVSRYDGRRVRSYAAEPGDPHSLAHDVVNDVYEDHAGTLWVATDHGLSRYEPARDDFVTYLRTEDDGTPRSIKCVREDRRGTLWVGTGRGLYQLDRRSGIARRVPLDPAGAAAPAVLTLVVGRDGALWVGTQQAGLYRVDPAGGAARHYAHDPRDTRSVPDTLVSTIVEDTGGALWVGTWAGLGRLDDARTGRFTRYLHEPANPRSLANSRVQKLAADPAGGLWVGTENGGLDHFDPASGVVTHHRFDPNVPTTIGSNSIYALYPDSTGALWVGTYSGGVDVSVPGAGAITHYRSLPGDPTSLSYNAVPSFAEGRDGRLWVATDGGGVNHFDPATGRFRRYTQQNTNLNAEAVIGAVEGRRGDVWVTAWGGGISELDPRTGRFTAYTTRNSNIPGDNAYEIIEDRAGRLWVGTEGGVVAEFDRRRRTFARQLVLRPAGALIAPVFALRELRDGRFAVGLGGGGLVVVDPATGARTRYVTAGGVAGAGDPGAVAVLAGDEVRAVYESEPGVLWVGTDRGLDRLVLGTRRVAHLGTADGLPSRFVDGVVPDGAGRLWISTDRGLSRLDPRTGAVKTFTRADGLQGSEFLKRSAFRARDGTLYFGGNNGFNAIRPERLVENTRRPPVVLTGLRLFDRPVAVGAPGSPLRRPLGDTDEVVLGHTQDAPGFEFAALDYTAPDKQRFRYRLEGYDAAWRDGGNAGAAAYTNLSPGRYTFRVTASNGDGVWNDAGASVRVVVTPPWWGTWWFRLLAAGAAVVAAYRVWRFQQRRRVEVALGRQALRDSLTGLANRALFRDRVEHALARLAREGGTPRAAVLYLDLDGFKAVNDSLGHHAGDELLRAVASRLLNATRGSDTVARFGGDEFAVLLEAAHTRADAEVVAGRIVAAVRAPIALGGGAAPALRPGASRADAPRHEARVGVSVGIAFAEPGVDADALLRNADAAMYRAKADGKGQYAVFDPALVEAAAERAALERDLARAVADLDPERCPGERGTPAAGEFALVYQPVVALATGAVASAEALLRWQHPTRGVVGPAEFIPLAEASGLIVALGRWVLDAACRAAAAWPAGPDGAPIGVAVNVSGRQLEDPAFPGHVAAALADSGIGAARLTLEITESVLMRDTDAALRTLGALKTLGVRLAVDDFGTGYSSLRYLQQFPVDVLKIDKTFVDGIARRGAPGGHDAAFARTIVALGETLALNTVAEGVEHAGQAELLRAMGCTFGQGYLFARPLDDAALRARLATPAACA
ncbi:hypothetical protein tb265_06580 [Gemmatimonadetes bacterium T265]|nr:hypothetical protein tb265_06580 [Gemmatimonadetes bacterium T265]